jgi:hypothetical protein
MNRTPTWYEIGLGVFTLHNFLGADIVAKDIPEIRSDEVRVWLHDSVGNTFYMDWKGSAHRVDMIRWTLEQGIWGSYVTENITKIEIISGEE